MNEQNLTHQTTNKFQQHQPPPQQQAMVLETQGTADLEGEAATIAASSYKNTDLIISDQVMKPGELIREINDKKARRP